MRDKHFEQYEICFGVWEQEKCTGTLRLIPLGYEAEEVRDECDYPRQRVYGLYFQARLEQAHVACARCDFIHPANFRRLRELLAEEPGAPEKVEVHGDDGGIEIHFLRRKGGGLSVAGCLPAKDSWTGWLADDPLLLTKGIKIAVHFEFWIEQGRMPEYRAEVEQLLEQIRIIEESDGASSCPG